MHQSRLGKHYSILYSRKDEDIAKQLKGDLEKNGFEVWMYEHGSGLGIDREGLIKENIQQSVAVLYLVSHTSRSSLYVNDGLNLAKIYRKAIIPLWVRGLAKWAEIVGYDLFSTNYIDMREESYKAGMTELTQLIKNLSDFEASFMRYFEENDDSWLPEVESIRNQSLTAQISNESQRNLPIGTVTEPYTPSQDVLAERAARTDVFICYSDKDEEYSQELLVHLNHICRVGIKVWTHTSISPGSDRHDATKRAIQSTKVGVFLVSADFFASDFIVDYELALLLEAAKSKEVTLLSVILRPCDAFNHSPLALFAAYPPLPQARDGVWSHLAAWLRKILAEQADR